MKIPIIFGCVGHINIEDNNELREKIKSIFLEYINKYKNSEFYLVTSLAEGADLLVAEVANELGVFLHIILPYDEKEYLQTFKNNQNIDRFYKLKSVAKKVETINKISGKKEDLYFEAGKRIVNLSNIMISLWDRVYNNKIGGTSSIIKYMETKSLEDDLLKILYFITTPRINKEIENKYCIEKREYRMFSQNKIDDVFKYIDSINKNITDITFNFFDKLAIKFQKVYFKISILILLLVFIGIVSYEYNSDLSFKFSTTIIYILSIFIAYILYYYFMKIKKIDEKFLLSRFIAECLRMQSNFNYFNLNKNVSEIIFFNDIIKFNWVKILINNIAYVYSIKNDFIAVPKEWIKSQIIYFDNAIKLREIKINFINNLGFFFKVLGFFVTSLLLIVFFSKYFYSFNVRKEYFDLMIFLSAIFFTIYGFLKEYLKILQYEEEVYNFKIMRKIFYNYYKFYNEIEENFLINELSLKAVNELVRWFEFHYNSIVKVNFIK